VNHLRAATLTVRDVDAAAKRYARWLDYRVVETAEVSASLAASWNAPASAGRRLRVLQPASGAPVYLRLVEGDIPDSYRALRSYGWAAIEICVNDVEAVAERMADSPFEIIGPPREIPGLSAIYPMQVKGPDEEIVYFTQIRDDLPTFDLPRAGALIDHLFILVMACSDLPASLAWMAASTGLAIGNAGMDIEYTMIAKAFGLPLDSLHTIGMMAHERDAFLELDQYPAAATTRPRATGQLVPGVSIGSIVVPDIDAAYATRSKDWICAPGPEDSCVYGGKRRGTLLDPDGTLIEVLER
jgi:catechol 2,3-dioxygenase-like lactoylglutathione lyase family enzyme